MTELSVRLRNHISHGDDIIGQSVEVRSQAPSVAGQDSGHQVPAGSSRPGEIYRPVQFPIAADGNQDFYHHSRSQVLKLMAFIFKNIGFQQQYTFN